MDIWDGLCFKHDPDTSRRAFVFDMYGTLVRVGFGGPDSIFEAFRRLFPDADPEDVRREYERFMDSHDSVRREMSTAVMLEHMVSVFDTGNDILEAEDVMMRATHTFIPVEGAQDTLRYFRDRGYRIGVLTNTSYRGSVVKGLLEDAGFDRLIDAVVSSADAGHRKPHGGAYDAVVTALGVRKKDCFFAGDDEEKDCLGPRRYGMRGSFLIDPSRPSRECGIVSSIVDIPAFFRDRSWGGNRFGAPGPYAGGTMVLIPPCG